MRNIQAQYRDLLEGKMSKANFMRNVRMQFPQHISPSNSFNDSVRILKSKRILSEIKTGRTGRINEVKIDGKEVKSFKQNGDKSYSVEFEDGTKTKIYVSHDDWDTLNNANKEKLSEAKLPVGVYGHNPNAEAEASRGIDHLNYYQVQRGIKYELAKMPEITDESYVKARKKVVDAILKNPDAYKDLQLANYKAVKDMDKDLEMKEVKKDNLVDKPNEMKVVKKDEKENTQATLQKKEAKKSKNGKGVEHMTQTPKGKLEAFPTPGKEKVMNLKEHILDELTQPNPEHEHISKGSRVKKKGLKDYDAGQVGNVVDFDGDTATVKWDDDKTEHVQVNILTKRDIPQHPEAKEKFGKLPNFGSSGQTWASGQVRKEDKQAKLKKLKERLVKALKKEGVKKNPKTNKLVSTVTPADDALAAKMGYTQTVPSTIEPIGKM